MPFKKTTKLTSAVYALKMEVVYFLLNRNAGLLLSSQKKKKMQKFTFLIFVLNIVYEIPAKKAHISFCFVLVGNSYFTCLRHFTMRGCK